MITNEEFQKEISRYPGDLPVGIAIKFNGNLSIFYDVKVEGIQSGDLKIVVIYNPDVDLEYETLMNGAEDVEENYS